MPKKLYQIKNMSDEDKKILSDVESFLAKAQDNAEVINIEWNTFDHITDYCSNLIDLYGTASDVTQNTSLSMMGYFDGFLHTKPAGSDKTNFELIAEANGGKYAEFVELLKKMDSVLGLNLHLDDLPRPDIKIEEPEMSAEELRNETVEGFREYIRSEGTGANARADKMIELNSYLKGNPDENKITGPLRDAMKQEIFAMDKDGNIDYSKAESFFTEMGRHAVNIELESLSSISEDPKTIQDKAYIKATEIDDMLSTAKAIAADDENIRSFNDNLDEYNKKGGKGFVKAQVITPELIQKWYDSGREYQLGRSKGYAKQNLLKNAANIREDAKKALGLDDDGLKAKQNEAMAKHAADCKKKVEDKYAEIVKNAPGKAAERKQNEQIKIDNEIKINDQIKINDEIKLNEQPDDKINDSNDNLNINEIAKEKSTTDAERLLNGLNSDAERLRDLDLKTDSAKRYANTWVEEIGQTETDLYRSKTPDHQDSTDYFKPMMDASEAVRGIGGNRVSHAEAIDRYDELINRCNRYINKRSWGWFDRFKSDEGRERLRLARQLKDYAIEMKSNYLKKCTWDGFNEAVNDFANSDFSTMTQDQIHDKITHINNMENRIYNKGMNLVGMQNDARTILNGADDKFNDYIINKIDADQVTNQVIVLSRHNNQKTLGEIMNEEKGINKTDSKHLADKLGIDQGRRSSVNRRSNANNNIIEDVKENTNKKQIKINS